MRNMLETPSTVLEERLEVLQLNKEGEEASGAYVFAPSEAFNALARLVIEKDYPMVLNMLEVPECDEDAFIRVNIADLLNEPGVPEGWN